VNCLTSWMLRLSESHSQLQARFGRHDVANAPVASPDLSRSSGLNCHVVGLQTNAQSSLWQSYFMRALPLVMRALAPVQIHAQEATLRRARLASGHSRHERLQRETWHGCGPWPCHSRRCFRPFRCCVPSSAESSADHSRQVGTSGATRTSEAIDTARTPKLELCEC
jgi:hypothetical protein